MPLHPKIVHFPVALILGAAFFGILAILFRSKKEFFKEVLYWNLLVGTAGAIMAVLTGLLEEKTLVHNDTIHEILKTHELLGFIFTAIFLALSIWIIIRKSKMTTAEFKGLIVLLILTSGLMGYSAHLGGKMVYEEGAGIIPMDNILLQQEEPHHHEDMHQHENEKTQLPAEHDQNENEHHHEHDDHSPHER